MESLARWTAGDGVRDLWLILSCAVLILPMVGLSVWYHRQIGRTVGGRRLMADQNAHRPRVGDPGLRAGGRMARKIRSGSYGRHARRLHNRVYLWVALWLVSCTILFGLMVWGSALEQTP